MCPGSGMSISSISAAAPPLSFPQAIEPKTWLFASNTQRSTRRRLNQTRVARSTPSSTPRPRARPLTSCARTRQCSTYARSWSDAAGPSPTGRPEANTNMARHQKTFTVGWLYPDLMNIYGDRGNILTLLKRAEWRDYEARLIELGRGTTKRMDEVDVFFFGGAQDREQALVYEDLIEHKQPPLQRAVAAGAGILAVCGGYQLLGHYYQTGEGERFPLLRLTHVPPEGGNRRFIGDG